MTPTVPIVDAREHVGRDRAGGAGADVGQEAVVEQQRHRQTRSLRRTAPSARSRSAALCAGLS